MNSPEYRDWLRRLNSATKYPSIDTYHKLDPSNGRLTENETVPFPEGPVLLTEKIDGTNGRIIMLPGDFFIGSREEILYAKGDRIENPALGIVQTLLPLAEVIYHLYDSVAGTQAHVLFLEVYGKGIGPGAKQYSSSMTGYRLFDLARVHGEVLTWDVEKIASWRDHGGQEFASSFQLTDVAERWAIPQVPLIGAVDNEMLPQTLAKTQEWMGRLLTESQAKLDEDAGGRPEGIVLRSMDRSVIAKARFQDYDRTLSPQRGKRGK